MKQELLQHLKDLKDERRKYDSVLVSASVCHVLFILFLSISIYFRHPHLNFREHQVELRPQG